MLLLLAAGALAGSVVGGAIGLTSGTSAALAGAGNGALAGAGLAGTAYALSRPRVCLYPTLYPFQYSTAPYPTYAPVYYAHYPRAPILYVPYR